MATPTAGSETSFYDDVLGPVRWSGKPLNFWYAPSWTFGNSKPVACVKAAHALWLGKGADISTQPLDIVGTSRAAEKAVLSYLYGGA